MPLSLVEGLNTEVVLAQDAAGLSGSDVAFYALGTPASIDLIDLHVSQRGVIKWGDCDFDPPFVAGKKMLVRIGLEALTASGIPTTVTGVDLLLYRQEASGDQLVTTLKGAVYPYGFLLSPFSMKGIVFWIPAESLAQPGKYRMEFQPFTGTAPFGLPLSKQCGGSPYFDVYETDTLNLLIVPVAASLSSPILNNTNTKTDFFKNLVDLNRTWPLKDYSSTNPGVKYYETQYFNVCDGSAWSMQTYPNICLGVGWEWKHIDKHPSGNLTRGCSGIHRPRPKFL